MTPPSRQRTHVYPSGTAEVFRELLLGQRARFRARQRRETAGSDRGSSPCHFSPPRSVDFFVLASNRVFCFGCYAVVRAQENIESSSRGLELVGGIDREGNEVTAGSC